MHIIEITVLIRLQPYFAQSQRPFTLRMWSKHVIQIQDGGRPPSWKIENQPYLRNGLIDRHRIWHGDTYWASEPDWKLKFLTFKNTWWGRPPSWKSEKNGHGFLRSGHAALTAWSSLLISVKDLPMWPRGRSIQEPCAVERDALSGRGSNLNPGTSAYQKLFLIIPTHMMNREIIPGRKKRCSL